MVVVCRPGFPVPFMANHTVTYVKVFAYVKFPNEWMMGIHSVVIERSIFSWRY
jgi:hypothetical protein